MVVCFILESLVMKVWQLIKMWVEEFKTFVFDTSIVRELEQNKLFVLSKFICFYNIIFNVIPKMQILHTLNLKT